jgi:hypothetical protein
MNITSNELAPWGVYAQTEWYTYQDEQSGVKRMKWINAAVYHFTRVPDTSWQRISPRFSTEAQALAYLPNIK